MTLFIANKNYSSWSLRAWLALKESGLAFEEQYIALGKENTLFQIQSRSPSGRLPLLKVGDKLIWDSLAIAEYAAETCEATLPLLPIDRFERAYVRSLCAEMHSGFLNIRNELQLNIKLRAPRDEISEDTRAEINRIFYAWTDCLGKFKKRGPYLFGAFSLADCFFAPIHFRFQSYGIIYPSQELLNYKNAILQRPFVREWELAALQETDRVLKYDLPA